VQSFISKAAFMRLFLFLCRGRGLNRLPQLRSSSVASDIKGLSGIDYRRHVSHVSAFARYFTFPKYRECF